jgi:hypothetical protein
MRKMTEDKFTDKAADPEVEMDKPVEPSFATKEDFAKLQGMVEGLSASFRNFGQSAPAPPQPTGPSQAEKIAAIDAQLVKLDTMMDDAIADGKSISKIQRQREELIQEKADIKYTTKIDELQSFGAYAIDQLTDKVVAADMPMLKYPEVKAAYDEAIGSMGPNQRMNPEVRMTAYNYACGKNQTLVFDKMFEERMRAEEVATQTPSTPGRDVAQKDDPHRIPDPSEYLSAENMAALEAAGKTPDQHYKSLGYADWADFWVKTGKAHFIGEEPEEEE